jgi:hypothetical protein
MKNLQTMTDYDRTAQQLPPMRIFALLVPENSELLSSQRGSKARSWSPAEEKQFIGAESMNAFEEFMSGRHLATLPSLLGAPQNHPEPQDARVEVQDFAVIQEAARRRDVRSFVAATQVVNWGKRSADELEKTIADALSLGVFVVAQQLAAQGAQHHRDDPSVQRLARMLAPTKVVRADLPADPGVLQNREWLKKHASEYRKRWVALENGRLLSSGGSIIEVVAKLSGRKGVLLMRVP